MKLLGDSCLWKRFLAIASASFILSVLISGCYDSRSKAPSPQAASRPIPADAPWKVRQSLEKLSDPDAGERAQAAFVLGELGQDAVDAVPHLLDALSDENGRVRSRAAEALGKIGDPRAVEPLIQLLDAKDPDWGVRARCVESLGKLRDARATQSLIAATEDMASQVRYQAAVALGAVSDPAATNALKKLAEYDPDPTVRNAAHKMLRSSDDQ